MRGVELLGKYTLVATPEPLQCLPQCAQVEALGSCASGPCILAEITGVGTYPTPDGPKPQVMLSPAGLICGKAAELDLLPPDILPELPELTD